MRIHNNFKPKTLKNKNNTIKKNYLIKIKKKKKKKKQKECDKKK